MATGRTNAGGAGGAALNFKVVPGLTQPGTASENTIWVKTESMTGWIIDANQPEELTEGMVWILVGTESAVEFNALKKNGIQVYPISAKQYVSGAWVSKTAKSYQGGKWVEFTRTYLYKAGDECTDITGGWVAVEGVTNNTFTKNANSMVLQSVIAALTVGPDTLGNSWPANATRLYIETGNMTTETAFIGLNSKKDRTGTELARLNLVANTIDYLSISDIDTGYLVLVALRGELTVKNIWFEWGGTNENDLY